ncbi:MAG: hypothetical protein ACM3SY_18200 [Candidatus Omnitrophota bacterium]
MGYTSTSRHNRGNESEIERFISHHATLKPGDKLEGKIIEIKPNGNVLIHFGAFRAVAQATFPITEGETIRVIVVSRYPKLKLQLENRDGEFDVKKLGPDAPNSKMLDVKA